MKQKLILRCIVMIISGVMTARISLDVDEDLSMEEGDSVLACDSPGSKANLQYKDGLDFNKMGKTFEAMKAFDEALKLCPPSLVYMGSAANMRLKLVQNWPEVKPEALTREELLQEALGLYAKALSSDQLPDRHRGALEAKQIQAKQLAVNIGANSTATADTQLHTPVTIQSEVHETDTRPRCPAKVLNAAVGRVPFQNVGEAKYLVRAGERNRGADVRVTCGSEYVKVENVDVTCSGRKGLCKDSVSAGIKACVEGGDTIDLSKVQLEFRARPYIAGCKCYVDAMAGIGFTQLATAIRSKGEKGIPVVAPFGLSDWCTKALSKDSPDRMTYFGAWWTFTQR